MGAIKIKLKKKKLFVLNALGIFLTWGLHVALISFG